MGRGKRKTHEQFVAEVEALVGEDYSILGEYLNNYTKVAMKHNVCSHIFEMRPNHLLCGRRCPECAKKVKRRWHHTTEQFTSKLKEKFGDKFEVISEYISARDTILVFCNTCRDTIETTPDRILRQKVGCPKCSNKVVGDAIKKSEDEFKRDVFNIYGEEFIVIGEYKGDKKRVEVKHTTCGHIQEVVPNSFLAGQFCKKCRGTKGEKFISDWLNERGIVYRQQEPIKYAEGKRALYLDFYVDGVAIEYDGEQHFTSKPFFGGDAALRKTQRRDHIKDKYCADNGIPLIRIPYWEYDNIDAILTEKLLPMLKENAAV